MIKKANNDFEDIELKHKIADFTMVFFFFLGLIVQVAIYFRAEKYGFEHDFILQNLSTLFLLFFILLKKKLSLNVKISGLTVILFITITVGLANYSFLASSKLFIVIIPVFLSLILSFRKTLAVFFVFIIVYGIFGFLYTSGYLKLALDANDYIAQRSVWSVEIIIILLTSLGLLLEGKMYKNKISENFNVIKTINIDLFDREKKYRLLFETSNDAIILIENNAYFDCNKRTLELFNCQPQYILGKTPHEFSPVFQPDGQLSSVKANQLFNRVNNGEVQIFEWQHVRPNGELFDVAVTLNLVILENNRYVQAVLHDITQRKKDDAELATYRLELENLVLERTTELKTANEELQAVNDELYAQSEELRTILEQLDKTKEQFMEAEKMASLGVLTAGVAHEINNPLNFIKTALYGFENLNTNRNAFDNDEQITEVQTMLIQSMTEGVGRISEIVKSLNHFNRTGNDKFEKCNIATVIGNCLRILNHEIKNKAEIILNYHSSEIIVLGIDGKLHQLFMNLIINAIHALNEKGTITISTTLKDEEDDEDVVCISIADNGIGISKENLKRIYDPFFTTKEAGKGTGLGLSIVYTIIQQHNGNITIESTENVGTTVKIRLPLIE